MKKLAAITLYLATVSTAFAQSFPSTVVPLGNINVLGTSTFATPIPEASGGSITVNADKYAAQGYTGAVTITQQLKNQQTVSVVEFNANLLDTDIGATSGGGLYISFSYEAAPGL